jgi:CyaY protein
MGSWYPQYWPGGQVLMETEYRKNTQVVLNRIEAAFENVDPDLAECEQAMGALTIILKDGSRCILSGQPSVKQLWLALASLGMAYHFNYDESAQQWIDDKGKGIELVSFLENFLRKATGLEIKI